jgi:hypothetical protein
VLLPSPATTEGMAVMTSYAAVAAAAALLYLRCAKRSA